MREIFREVRPASFGAKLDDVRALEALRAAGKRAPMWRTLIDLLAAKDLVPAAKIFYPHAGRDDAVWREFRSATVLHLIRENVLETVTSQLIATKTGNWAQASRHDAAEYGAATVHVPRARCVRHVKKSNAAVAWARSLYRDCDYAEITYARISTLATAEQALSAALSRPIGLTPPRLAKQRTRPLPEVVENYAEVAEFDRDFDFGGS